MPDTITTPIPEVPAAVIPPATVAGTDADEPLGEAGKAALVRERATAKAEKARADAAEARIKEFEDRDKSEAQKLQDRLDASEARAKELELDNLRRDVAAEKGLTPAQAKRLVGTTRDEFEADADDLLQAIPSTTAPQQYGDVGQGHRGTPISGDPRDAFARFIQGRT